MLTRKDLEVAWRRVKLDRPKRCFVTHPFVLDWIESDLDGWFQAIERELSSRYIPQDCQTCYSPKGGWMVRPGAVLDLKDETVFNALLGKCYPNISDTLRWSQGTCDVAYQLNPAIQHNEWIRSGFRIWKEWREKSLSMIDSRVKFVLFTDIAGFYENIDLGRLHSELNSLRIESSILQLLMNLLNRWSHPQGRGIPQGYSGSDILAKLYLNPVDLDLHHSGFIHLSYVDDFRIFCKTAREAKSAVLKLTELLRYRGLTLQSAKTKILSVAKARKKIDGVTPVVQRIQAQLGNELSTLYEAADRYASLPEIDSILSSHPDSPAPEVLERAFAEHFGDANAKFDQTLFHYLLNRLSKTNSRIAVEYCISNLPNRPEETAHILWYLQSQNVTLQEYERIFGFAGSAGAIYDYQLYEIVRWAFYRSHFPDTLVSLCRMWATDKNRQPWLRSYCLAVLGKAGDQSDLEMIERAYATVTTGIEKADIIAAVDRMENNRRNRFYGRVRTDGFLPECAVNFISPRRPAQA
jgi:hypothetical protein